MRPLGTFRACAAIALIGAAAISASADVSSTIFRIEATAAGDSGWVDFDLADAVFNPATGAYVWSTGLNEIPLNGDPLNDPVAILSNATMTIVSDPQPGMPYRINFNFAIVANDVADTLFRMESGELTFPELSPSQLMAPNGGGKASATFGVTDVGADGVQLVSTSGAWGNGAHTSQYNGMVPNGTTFASLVNTVMSSGGGASGTQSQPAGTGYNTINEAVSSMQTQAEFTLSAGDTANGVTKFAILPEPSALMLVAAGSLLLGVRRR